MRLSAVCKNIGLAKVIAEQWIARGILVPENATSRGAARDLTFRDAVRFAMAARLSGGTQPISRIMPAVMLHLLDVEFEDDEAVLVIREGGSLGALKLSKNGRSIEKDLEADLRGSYVAFVVPRRARAKDNKGPEFDIEFNLDYYKALVRAFWRD